MKYSTLLLPIFLLLFLAQSPSAQGLSSNDEWWHLDPSQSGIYGISTHKARQFLSARTASRVIVAIIDSGFDFDHEDLAEKIWHNENEIAGNGIDDDGNGYVDDIYGWNFLGNEDGENLEYDTFEKVRQVQHLEEKFKDLDPQDLKGKEKRLYSAYQEMKEEIEDEREEAEQTLGELEQFLPILERITEVTIGILGDQVISGENLNTLSGDNEEMIGAIKNYYSGIIPLLPREMKFSEFLEEIREQKEYFEVQLKYEYNSGYDPRDLIGDDRSNPRERHYGNNDVEGPDPSHGTGVAGVIGASTANGKGINGVADHVELMLLRAVPPSGDERDKDIANAILYAVDNGASIINMSFGKSISPNRQVVDDAILHAEKNDVLIVHASGNEGENIDETYHFPVDRYDRGFFLCRKRARHMIEVGAISRSSGTSLLSEFSNYGKKEVDVFAPGQEMWVTAPEDSYDVVDGTSFAAPVVSGIAALIRGYFPDLKARHVKKIIMDSAIRISEPVTVPGNETEKPLDQISRTGGVVNAYEAVRMAAEK
jgi:cell wall-associated protease